MSRGRVLIVEDDVRQALALADNLRDAGYDVVATAAAVNESVEALNRHDVDVAVLDLELGGRISLPVARLLRERHIPFVVVSGHDVRRFAEELRGAPVFQKPVPKDVLLDALAGRLNVGTERPARPTRSGPFLPKC